jgi:hypothetical protein
MRTPHQQENSMKQKIRITTRASQFEKRKQEHLQAGYQIEDEQPFPINGLCSFTAIRVVTDDDSLLSHALTGRDSEDY